MYPTVPHDERHYPGISNTNIQLNTPPQAYAAQPEYIVSGRPTYGGVGKWSTGLCHCCDDPANCENLKPHLSQSPISRNKHIKSCFIY